MPHFQARGARQDALQRPGLLYCTDKGEPASEAAVLENGPRDTAAVGTGPATIRKGEPWRTPTH